MCFFFQAEDGIRDLVRSRGLGDVYKRQEPVEERVIAVLLELGEKFGDEQDGKVTLPAHITREQISEMAGTTIETTSRVITCLLYTSDAADERSSVDLGGRRIIKKKKKQKTTHVKN